MPDEYLKSRACKARDEIIRIHGGNVVKADALLCELMVQLKTIEEAKPPEEQDPAALALLLRLIGMVIVTPPA